MFDERAAPNGPRPLSTHLIWTGWPIRVHGRSPCTTAQCAVFGGAKPNRCGRLSPLQMLDIKCKPGTLVISVWPRRSLLNGRLIQSKETFGFERTQNTKKKTGRKRHEQTFAGRRRGGFRFGWFQRLICSRQKNARVCRQWRLRFLESGGSGREKGSGRASKLQPCLQIS